MADVKVNAQFVKNLEEARKTLESCITNAEKLAKTGDEDAMRALLSAKSDLATIDRVLKRAKSGYYS